MLAEQPSRFRHKSYPDLHIFTRETGGWYAGFHKGGIFHRKSMRTHHLPVALTAAEDWFLDCKAQLRLNQFNPKPRHSIHEAARLSLQRLRERVGRGERSSQYLKGIELLLNSELLPFFGDIDVTQVGPAKWAQYEEALRSKKPSLTIKTLHQHRNALRICLNEGVRREWIERLPTLKIDSVGKSHEHPRTWLEPPEMRQLLKVAKQHIKTLSKTRWAKDAEDCYDFILWMANTGMRVGEARNVRFCDVKVLTEKGTDQIQRHFCMIRNIRGKRGTGECRSGYAAHNAFERLIKRRGIENTAECTDRLFPVHYGAMFNTILTTAGLKFTKTEPRMKRDFVSLRHTYIAMRLIQGVGVYDIARNCRTSVAMIEQHYARYLSPRLLTNLNRLQRSQPSV